MNDRARIRPTKHPHRSDPHAQADASAIWGGRVRLGSFWALHRGAIGDNRPHAHHALQISAARSGLLVDFGDKARAVNGIFISSMRRHSLAPSHDTLSLYLDAASPIGRWLAGVFGSRADHLESHEAEALYDLHPNMANDDAIVSCLRRLSAAQCGQERSVDARLTQALALLEEELGEPLPLQQLSADISLSEGRLSRLFQQELGLPYRPYRRWRRVYQALLFVQGGANLTEAAIAAGFSDSAHFSRTFRQVFGVRPSEIAPLLN